MVHQFNGGALGLGSSVDGGRLGVGFGGLVAWLICGFQGWWVVGLVDGF